MRFLAFITLACGLLVLLNGCARLFSDYEAPQVQLVSFLPLPVEGLDQRFQIRLRILNPNRAELAIHGVAYHFSLNGYQVISGVSNNVPTILGYGEEVITLQAGTNLLTGGRFIFSMLQGNNDEIVYEFKAKLDVGMFSAPLKLVETGALSSLQ